jgi:8-oxo-dGTP diphosphatase
MKCPDGFCRDAEYCMQGGRCEDAVGDLTPLVTRPRRCIPARNRATLVGAVHLFLTNAQGELLLLRRANTGYEDGNYSVPAGHIDPGESAEQAMVREANEETGIVINPMALALRHVMHRRSVGADCTNSERVDFFFTATYFDGEPVNLEPQKCDEVRWVRMKPLPANVVPYVRRAFEYYRQDVPYSEIGWDAPCPSCGSVGRVA